MVTFKIDLFFKIFLGMDSLPRFKDNSTVGPKTSPRNSSWLPPEFPNRVGSNRQSSRRPSTVSTLSGSQMDAMDSCSSSPIVEKRKIFSEEVSAKALKNVLMVSQKDQSDENERRKMKQDEFIYGSFENIVKLIEKPGPNLNEHLTVLFKKLEAENNDVVVRHTENDESVESDYSVMNDNEPYMKFCPQIFMY